MEVKLAFDFGGGWKDLVRPILCRHNYPGSSLANITEYSFVMMVWLLISTKRVSNNERQKVSFDDFFLAKRDRLNFDQRLYYKSRIEPKILLVSFSFFLPLGR